jgi:hypothetical protein
MPILDWLHIPDVSDIFGIIQARMSALLISANSNKVGLLATPELYLFEFCTIEITFATRWHGSSLMSTGSKFLSGSCDVVW